jgi:hypothetical protein
MDFIHPHNVGKTLGVIHEEQPALHPIDLVRSATPPQRPSTYLLDPNGPFFSLKALMQGFSPECGGYSIAQFIDLIQVLKGNAGAALSGSFDYAYEKTVDGFPRQDGTTISAIGKAGNLAGSCLLPLFPDDGNTAVNPNGTIETHWSTVTEAAIQDALTRLLGQPFQLTDLSIDGVHQACYENSAVILEVEVGNEWYTASNGQTSWNAADILPIRTPKSIIDSHFILVAPYDEPNDRTWFINSWSPAWGQNGFGYFKSNYAPFIKSGLTFKPIPPSVTTVLNSQSIPTPAKRQLIQIILDDIAQALGLISKEFGQL